MVQYKHMRRFTFGGIKGIIDDDGTLYQEVSSEGEVVSKEEPLAVRGKYKKHGGKIIRKCKTCGGPTHGRGTCPQKPGGAPDSSEGKRKSEICPIHKRSHGRWPCPGVGEHVTQAKGLGNAEEEALSADEQAVLEERVIQMKKGGKTSLQISAILRLRITEVKRILTDAGYTFGAEDGELPPDGEPEE